MFLALIAAKESPLYSAAEFEDGGGLGVEFTMIYFTQLGEEKHGQPHERILTVLFDSDVTEMGPLLSVIKFEKKSSGLVCNHAQPIPHDVFFLFFLPPSLNFFFPQNFLYVWVSSIYI